MRSEVRVGGWGLLLLSDVFLDSKDGNRWRTGERGEREVIPGN